MAMELWRQADLLRRVRRGIADLELSRERVQVRSSALAQQEAKLAGQAAKARQMGREDLARVAEARRQEAEGRRGELAVQRSFSSVSTTSTANHNGQLWFR